MEITEPYTKQMNIKGQLSMSNILKALDSEKNYSKFRRSLEPLDFQDLDLLLSAYGMFPFEYKMEIGAITEELELRNSPLGKELV